jgi:NAD/NADP transhydrogenase beta subunit
LVVRQFCLIPTSIFGVWYAYSDRLPELVGLFNSFGGLAAALEGIAVYLDRTSNRSMYTGALLTDTEQKIQLVGMFLSIVVGMMVRRPAVAVA